MARNKPPANASEDEKPKTGESEGEDGDGGPEDVSPPNPPMGGQVETLPAIPPKKGAPKTKVPQYRVLNGGRIAMNGSVTMMRPGKLIDARTYDLEALRAQGIRLEPAGEIET